MAEPFAVSAHVRVREVLHGGEWASWDEEVVGDDGTVWFLEVNVAPGFTETSLVPLSVEAAGLELGEVLASLVRVASARDARTPR